MPKFTLTEPEIDRIIAYINSLARRPLRQMVLGLCLIAPAAAADDGDRNFQATLEKGRAIAEANCSPCHAVGPTDASPTRVNASATPSVLLPTTQVSQI